MNSIGQVDLIREMVQRFDTWREKRDADPIFRIHWNGDFFSELYLRAWLTVAAEFPHIQFWTYTRSFDFLSPTMMRMVPDNLTIYLSTDVDNVEAAHRLLGQYSQLRAAYCGVDFRTGLRMSEQRPIADDGPFQVIRCPENVGTKPLADDEGRGACTTCRLCIGGKADIIFASSKREDVSVKISRKQGHLPLT